ncbi:MAG: hypothetical protein AAGI01_10700 [Myxococcota bacterium]
MLHFPWTMIGLGLPCIFLLESLLRAARGLHRRDPGGWLGLRRAHALVAAAVVTAAMAIATFYPTVTPGDDAFIGAQAPAESVEAWIVSTPTEGRVFHAAARVRLLPESPSRDLAQVLRLAQRAMELEPLPHSYLLLAHTLHVSERDEEAAEVYAGLLDHQATFGLSPRAVELFVRDVRDPRLLARALARATPGAWSLVLAAVRAQSGWPAALDVLMEGTEVREDRAAAWEALIRFCIDESQYELALAWLGVTLQAPELQRDERAEFARLELDVLARLGRHALMERKLAAYLLEFPENRHLVFRALRALGSPLEAPRELVARVRDDHGRFCRGVMTPTERSTCDRVKAWMLEHEGLADEAIDALELLASSTGRRAEFVDILVRQRRCVRLRVWAKRNQLAKQMARDFERCEGTQEDTGPP